MTKFSTIGITGVDGMLGRYISLYYRYYHGVEVRAATRQTFAEPDALRQFVDGCDMIVHCAGVNRAPDGELEAANPAIANKLVAALKASDSTAHLFYASSIHEKYDTPYGRSKRIAGDILERWADAQGGTVSRLILPHLYCELTQPFYNSAIATFCHQLANNQELTLTDNGEVEPIHASEVCAFIDSIDSGGIFRLRGTPEPIHELVERLKVLHSTYQRQEIPEVHDRDTLHLFNTYRAHAYPTHYPVYPSLHADGRGNLFEAVRDANGGQVFISTTKPGITRGDHFHFHKIERFSVLRGEAVIRIRPIWSDTVQEFTVSGATPCFIDMPTLHTHHITNTGTTELLTLFWANEWFDSDSPDTYQEPV